MSEWINNALMTVSMKNPMACSVSASVPLWTAVANLWAISAKTPTGASHRITPTKRTMASLPASNS